MPKRNRLTGAEIRRLNPQKRLSSGLFLLSLSSHATRAAIACIVSKKVAADATARNVIKRRMRAALASVELSPHTAHLLIAKPAARAATYAEIQDDIVRLLARARGEK